MGIGEQSGKGSRLGKDKLGCTECSCSPEAGRFIIGARGKTGSGDGTEATRPDKKRRGDPCSSVGWKAEAALPGEVLFAEGRGRGVAARVFLKLGGKRGRRKGPKEEEVGRANGEENGDSEIFLRGNRAFLKGEALEE